VISKNQNDPKPEYFSVIEKMLQRVGGLAVLNLLKPNGFYLV
jgi:hypothetical protein